MPPSNVTARVNSLRTKASPWSASSFSARTSTGTTSEVSTAPSTISVIRLGSWFAVVNAEAIAAPKDEPMSTLRIKPVIRESNVATAMEPVARTTSPSLVCTAWGDFSVDLSSTAGGTGTGFFSSGTGAGGEGCRMRWRKPTEAPSEFASSWLSSAPALSASALPAEFSERAFISTASTLSPTLYRTPSARGVLEVPLEALASSPPRSPARAVESRLLLRADSLAAATAVAAACSSVTEGLTVFDGETGCSCFSVELRDLGLSSTFLLPTSLHYPGEDKDQCGSDGCAIDIYDTASSLHGDVGRLGDC